MNRSLSDENTGLLQAIRDLESLVGDLREQLAQVRAELEGAVHQNKALEGEKAIHEIQIKLLIASGETNLSWLRSQKALLEAESSKALQSGRLADDFT